MFLYIDCQNGISGDMMLGALMHIGLDINLLQDIMAKAGISYNLKAWQENRAGGCGYRIEVSWDKVQTLRYPADISKIFAQVNISEKVRIRAEHILNALVEAEAYAHGIEQAQVHFHEVGAIDTLVDILGVAWGMEQLNILEIRFSALPMFRGWIECEHGRICLPAPATAYLMQGKNIFQSEACTELITPTGAAIVHGLMLDYGVDFKNNFFPMANVKAMGTGYGSYEAPNGLRLWLLEDISEEKLHNNMHTQYNSHSNLHRQAEDMVNVCKGECEEVIVFETHLDHLTGEELGYAIEKLSESEKILDVLWLSGITKKNRPAGNLSVICLPMHIVAVSLDIFLHTHTLGLRWQNVKRIILPRKAVVDNCGNIKAKSYVLGGEEYIRAECESQKIMAENKNVGLPSLRFSVKHNK